MSQNLPPTPLAAVAEHWRKLKRAAARGQSTKIPFGVYEMDEEAGGYRLVGMQVNSHALDELVAVDSQRQQLMLQQQAKASIQQAQQANRRR